MGENRLPSGATLSVTLLDRPDIHMHAPVRPAATGCGVCHRPWRKHKRGQWVVMSCSHCGVAFSDLCYFRRITSSRERALFDAEGGEVGYQFHCAGCRS
jgi:ribosomal protein L37AE/L43A